MSHYHYPAANTTPGSVFHPGPHAVLAMGGLGAICGGTAAVARNIRRVGQGGISREAAVQEVLKESAGAGIATAAATFVVGSVGAAGFLGLLGIVTVATGTRYLWDSAMDRSNTAPDHPGKTAEPDTTAKTTRTGRANTRKSTNDNPT